MSRSKAETVIMIIAAAILLVAVAYIFVRMQVLRPVDYREDMRFKSLPTANPPV
ncbi:MAG: hypothetical protein ABL973_15215 [Micropepsaceae bacterium]